MRQPGIVLSDDARDTLGELAAACGGSRVPRLKELYTVALTVDVPEDDDTVLRASDGTVLLTVSRDVIDRLDGEAELVVGFQETGEPDFRLVRIDGRQGRSRNSSAIGPVGARD